MHHFPINIVFSAFSSALYYPSLPVLLLLKRIFQRKTTRLTSLLRFNFRSPLVPLAAMLARLKMLKMGTPTLVISLIEKYLPSVSFSTTLTTLWNKSLMPSTMTSLEVLSTSLPSPFAPKRLRKSNIMFLS